MPNFSMRNEELLRKFLTMRPHEICPEPSYVVNSTEIPQNKISYFQTDKETNSLFLAAENDV